MQSARQLVAAELHGVDRDGFGHGDRRVRPKDKVQLVEVADIIESLPPREQVLRDDAQAVLTTDRKPVNDDSHPLPPHPAQAGPLGPPRAHAHRGPEAFLRQKAPNPSMSTIFSSIPLAVR